MSAPIGVALLDPQIFVRQTIIGIQNGFVLFLIASGLTVILGILDVLNLAHGELFALGSFVSLSVFGFLTGSVMQPPTSLAAGSVAVFIGLVLLAAIVSAAVMVPIGAVVEAVFIRPIYDRDESYQLVLTFAVLLIIADGVQLIWGSANTSLFGLRSSINLVPTFELIGLSGIPSTTVFIILVGVLVGGGLFYFFDRTRTGRIIRATAIDREMAQALGVSPDRTFTLVFAFGAFLAGFAGGMRAIATGPQLGMGESALVQSFVVIVVGGLGSLRGALVGALVVGILSSWMVRVYPPLQTAAPFLVMLAVLLVRPEGLFGSWGERE
ncbi:MAG: branched-chain amino acid ABC transporter permease [Salinirussus sp.]